MKGILFLNFIVLSIYNMGHPVTPEILLVRDAPLFLNAFLYATMSLAAFIFSPIWGRYIDKKGAKFLMIGGTLLYGVSQFFFWYCTNFNLMILFRFISGITSSAFIVGISYYVNYYAKENKARYFGYMLASTSLGGIVGQLFSGFIVGKNNNILYLPFLLQFIFGVIVSISMMIGLKNIKINTDHTEKKIGLIKLLREYKLLGMLIIMVILALANNLYYANIGFYFASTFGFSSLGIGFVNAMSSFIVLIMNVFLLNKIEKLFKINDILRFNFILAMISMFLVIITSGTNMIFVFIALFVTTGAVYRPLCQGILVSRSYSNSGVILGLANSANSLGMISGSILSGIFFDIYYNLPFIMIIVFMFIGLIFMMFWEKYEF